QRPARSRPHATLLAWRPPPPRWVFLIKFIKFSPFALVAAGDRDQAQRACPRERPGRQHGDGCPCSAVTRGGSHAEGRPEGPPGDDPALAPEGAGDLCQDARVGPRGVWRRRGASSSCRLRLAQAL